MPACRQRSRLSSAALAISAAALIAGCGSDAETAPRDSAELRVAGSAAAPAEFSGLRDCRTSKPAIEGFRCGSIERPKFAGAPERGSFEIGFAVRTRTDRSSPSEGAIFAVEGGPGYSSTGTANAFVKLFGPLLDHRELVLVDMRGTGRSEPLRCPDVQLGRAPEWLGLAECARRLGPDFEAYNTGAAADDIDGVRRALGLDRITLYGDSYGTFLAQSYAFRHPENARRGRPRRCLPRARREPLVSEPDHNRQRGIRDRLRARALVSSRGGRPARAHGGADAREGDGRGRADRRARRRRLLTARELPRGRARRAAVARRTAGRVATADPERDRRRAATASPTTARWSSSSAATTTR